MQLLLNWSRVTDHQLQRCVYTPCFQCNKMCDEGEKTRDVVCIINLGANKKHILPESQCDSNSKPPTAESCNNGPCAAGAEWITSEWSGVSDKSCSVSHELWQALCIVIATLLCNYLFIWKSALNAKNGISIMVNKIYNSETITVPFSDTIPAYSNRFNSF